jgi:predicted metal-dependent hydrolase
MRVVTLETGVVTLPTMDVPYVVIRTAARRRSVGYRLEAVRGVVFRAHPRVKVGALEGIIRARAAWMIKHLKVLREAPPTMKLLWGDGGVIPLRGKPITLAVTEKRTALKAVCVKRSSTLHITVPRATGVQVERAVREWAEARAKVLFAARIQHWSVRMGVQARKLALSNATRRWGSCSHHNVIRLNWRLLLVPPVLLDYVVVHELAHITHKHHGPAFWACVAGVMPAYKGHRKALNALGGSLL